MTGNVETFHEDGRWWNREVGGSRFRVTYPRRDEAVAIGIVIADLLGVEHTLAS